MIRIFSVYVFIKFVKLLITVFNIILNIYNTFLVVLIDGNSATCVLNKENLISMSGLSNGRGRLNVFPNMYSFA